VGGEVLKFAIFAANRIAWLFIAIWAAINSGLGLIVDLPQFVLFISLLIATHEDYRTNGRVHFISYMLMVLLVIAYIAYVAVFELYLKTEMVQRFVDGGACMVSFRFPELRC
jgi:hypothetical protein